MDFLPEALRPQSGPVAYFLSWIVQFALFASLYGLEVVYRTKFRKIWELFRWILFLPATTLRVLIFDMILVIHVSYLETLPSWLSDYLFLAGSALFTFYNVALTIPRLKKSVPLALGSIWAVLGILEVLNRDPQWEVRIFQVITIVLAGLAWIRIPKSEIRSWSEET